MADENVKRGMVCATFGALSWGLSGTCGQYLFMHYTIDALLLTNIRMLGAGIVLMILVISLQRQTLTALLHNRRDMVQLAAFSVFGLVTCQLTYLSAIQYANSGTATVLQSLNVALMSCIAAIRFRRWPDRWQIMAVILALAGASAQLSALSCIRSFHTNKSVNGGRFPSMPWVCSSEASC